MQLSARCAGAAADRTPRPRMHSSVPLCASGRRLSVTGLLGRATERAVRRRSGRPCTATQDAQLRAALRERTAPERHRVAGSMGDKDLARNAPRQRRRGQRRQRTRISAAWGRSEPQPEGPRDARHHPPGPARKVSIEPANQRKERKKRRRPNQPIPTNQPGEMYMENEGCPRKPRFPNAQPP